ncbi:MAG: DUF342 domain-containing protein [Halanaerobiaceae bacterium]
MKKTLKIEAANEKKALSRAKEKMRDGTDMDIDEGNLAIKLVNKKKGFLGFGREINVYEITYNDKGVSTSEEEFLDVAVDSISIDGEFKLKVVDEGIFLKVKAPQGDGKMVSLREVKKALDDKEIVEVDMQQVQEILKKADNEWGLIAPRKPELDRDAEITVDISKDKLKALISYTPALGGKKADMEEFLNTLQEAGVEYGINRDKLKQIIEKRQPVESSLVAEGDPPQPGKDAELIYHFEQNTDSIGTKREDGSIDFYNLGRITNVQPGDVLVTKEDPEPGLPGKGVTGEELPPPDPQNKNLPCGKNTEIKDEKTLVAGIAGQVVVDERNRVQVLPVHKINGDVDLGTGNIDFVGNVIVQGNVTEGFKIRADGNVEIRGHVSVADIEAGGDVVIKQGFIGKNKCEIKARGNVQVKFVENGIIKAEKSIEVVDAVMHSKLTAGDSITVTGKKGLLVGGVTRARSNIEANLIGSSLATITKLEVGLDPELKSRTNTLEEEIKKANKNLLKTEKGINILEKMKKQQNGLPEKKMIMYYQLKKTREQLEISIEEKREELYNLESKLETAESGYIQANKKVFPGVKMIIGKSQKNIHNELERARFVEQKGEIIQLSVGR